MKVYLYSIRDLKVGFGFPFVQSGDAAALRNFENMMKDERYEISKNPDDFELFSLGSYDTENGTFDTHLPKFVVKEN